MTKLLVVDQVSKKFRRGELYDSLRDWLPAVARKLVKRQPSSALSKREFWALRDVSLSLERGEVLGVIGHNGAGKSTLLKLLSGVLAPTAGKLQVNGSLSALIEVGAGFHPDLTGRENVYLYGTILGMKRAEIAKKFDQIVDFSGLEEFIDTPVKRYSTGMYARLGFAVSAHVDPDVLIVDEVLSVGDYVFQNKCLQRMRTVVKEGTAVIFVSHNLHAMTSLCNRGILLDHGRVLVDAAPDQAVNAYMKRIRETDDSDGKEVAISRMTLRGTNGPCVHFHSGDEAFIDVEIKALRRHEKLSVSLELQDGKCYPIFDTSTERLGHSAFTIEAGETTSFTFKLQLHLANGAYNVGARIYRYDIEKTYDERIPLATLYVSAANDYRGIAALYPVVEMHSRDSAHKEHRPTKPAACEVAELAL